MGQAYFRFDQPPLTETFVIAITDPKTIEQARRILAGSEDKRSGVSGRIIKRPAWYNAPWRFHIDPSSIGFDQIHMEVCDSTIGNVEQNLDEVGGAFLPRSHWCPWGSRLIEEITLSGRTLEFKAICTEIAEHDGSDYPLTDWLPSEDAANTAGKEHELATKGHRWRVLSREQPEHHAPAARLPRNDRRQPSSLTLVLISPDRRSTAITITRGRFIFEIIGLAISVYEAYTSFKDAVSSDPDPVETALTEVRQGIQRINETLHEIRATLDEILALLKNLPAVLTGIVDKNTLEESLQRLHGIVDAIRNYLGDIATFAKAQHEVEALCNRLQEQMYVAINFSRAGLAAIVNVTPAYVVYARAWMMLYRLRTGTRFPDIWATTMHAKMMDVFREVFEQHHIFQSALSTELLGMPKSATAYKFDGTKFIEQGPTQRCYASAAHNPTLASTFQFGYLDDGSGTIFSLLHQQSACWIPGTVDWIQVPGYVWWDATKPAPWDDPGHVAGAEAKFRQFVSRRKEILEYFAMMKNAEDCELRIKECLSRP